MIQFIFNILIIISSFLLISCNPEKENKLKLGHLFDNYRAITIEHLGSTSITADGGSQSTIVRLTIKDKWNKLSTDETVNLTVPTNGGRASSTSQKTNTSGQVEFTIYSSTVAGVYTYEVNILGNKTTFTLTFTAGSPRLTVLTLTGPSTLTANGAATTSFAAVAFDQYSNRVKNTQITLAIPENGGTSVGSNPCTTDNNGECIFVLRSSTLAGSYAYSASATGASVSSEITINFVAGVVSTISFSFPAPSTMTADGTSTKLITAIIRDQYSNPISGNTVTLNIPPDGGSVPGSATSNVTGTATFLLTSSTIAGTYSYSVTSGGRTSTNQSITFLSQDPSSITLTLTGSSSILADGISSTTLVAYAEDANGNPSEGRSLSLNIPIGGGSANTPTTTNSTGHAYFTLISGTSAGTYAYTASFGGTNSNLVNVDFYANVPATINLSVTGSTSIVANGVSTTTLVASVYDVASNPVENATITLNIPVNGGTVPGNEFTDASGNATFTLTSSTTTGTYSYTASSSNGITSTSKSITFTPSNASQITLVTLGSSSIDADGFSTTTLQAVVQDASFNPVPNVTVTLNIPLNGGTVSGTVDTDEGGAANFTLRSSIIVGTYNYTASIIGPITSNTTSIDFVAAPLPAIWSIHTTSVSGSKEVQLYEQYAFVADSENGLSIIDITDNVTPLAGSYDPGLEPVSDVALDASKNYAYLANNGDGIVVLDVSVPAAPVLETTLSVTDSAVSLQTNGDYLFSIDSGAGLSVYDITTPDAPVLLSNLDLTDDAINVEIVGDYAYVTATNSLSIIDISNIFTPTLLSTYTDNVDELSDIKISGNYAYLTNNQNLLVVNISNPLTPSFTATVSTSATASGIELYQNYAFVSVGSSGLEVFNISNPAAPVSDNTYLPVGLTTNASGIGIDRRFIYLLEDEGGVQIIDVLDPTTPDQTL